MMQASLCVSKRMRGNVFQIHQHRNDTTNRIRYHSCSLFSGQYSEFPSTTWTNHDYLPDLRKYIGYPSRVAMTISVNISVLSKQFRRRAAGAKDNPENSAHISLWLPLISIAGPAWTSTVPASYTKTEDMFPIPPSNASETPRYSLYPSKCVFYRWIPMKSHPLHLLSFHRLRRIYSEIL